MTASKEFSLKMSVSKALQYMDKRDLECDHCCERFDQPKTLQCMHTFCLNCIEEMIATDLVMECPKCGEKHDLMQEDIKWLPTNIMISQLLKYVIKTEDRKPSKCSFCDNQPAYHCPTCELYLCKAQCFKCHEKIPASKEHPLYTLDVKEQDGSSDLICLVHDNTYGYYCFTCKTLECVQCHQAHSDKIIDVRIFNIDVKRDLKFAQRIKKEYKKKIDRKNDELASCRNEIECRNKMIEELMQEIETFKEMKVECDRQLESIGLNLTEATSLITSISNIMSRPEEIKTLAAHKKTINCLGDKFDFIPGTFPCNEQGCKLCRHINRSSSSITGPNMKVILVNQKFTCESTNVIYYISCAKCPDGVYVGQTSKPLKTRMAQHRSQNGSVSEHFKEGHKLTDFQVAVLICVEDQNERENKESYFIKYFNCIKMGLNKIH